MLGAEELARCRRLFDPAVSLERSYAEINDPRRRMSQAAGCTVEALAHQLRGGVRALREPSALRRISELREPQMREIAQRLTKERWSKSGETRRPPWERDEIETFIRIWGIANATGH